MNGLKTDGDAPARLAPQRALSPTLALNGLKNHGDTAHTLQSGDADDPDRLELLEKELERMREEKDMPATQ